MYSVPFKALEFRYQNNSFSNIEYNIHTKVVDAYNDSTSLVQCVKKAAKYINSNKSVPDRPIFVKIGIVVVQTLYYKVLNRVLRYFNVLCINCG